ncbi:MAG: hypothetical protein Q8P23_00945 [bacterium]|nr:hypothetical protein [bacterium]
MKVTIELDEFTIRALEAICDVSGVTGDDRLAWLLTKVAESAARAGVALQSAKSDGEIAEVFGRAMEQGREDWKERRKL